MKWKRRKTKRTVRCSLCTPYRWKGNGSGRFKPKEESLKKELDKEMKFSR